MDSTQLFMEDYKEYLEDIKIAISAMKDSLLYPKEEILFDLYAIPSHNHQAYYAVITEKDGTYEIVYAKTEINYIEIDDPVRMYDFTSAKQADASSNMIGKIIVGIKKVDTVFIDNLKDIDDCVSDGKYFYNDFMLDGVFQAIRVYKSEKPSKEIIYENTDVINLPENKEYLREILENMYLTVESIIAE